MGWVQRNCDSRSSSQAWAGTALLRQAPRGKLSGLRCSHGAARVRAREAGVWPGLWAGSCRPAAAGPTEAQWPPAMPLPRWALRVHTCLSALKGPWIHDTLAHLGMLTFRQ